MQNRRQRLDLPFMKRRTDVVTWIYDHRAGVFSLLALALVMAILFVGSKIAVRTPQSDDGIVVDLRTVEELRREAERLRREVRQRQSEADLSLIRNAISNEGAEVRDDRSMSDMNSRIDRTNESMQGNRDVWDEGLREIDAMKGARDGENERNTTDRNNDSRAKGTVQISFSLINPTRYSVYIHNPGFRCERGGEVTVQITVNRNGDVVGAAVDKGSSTNDICMHEAAIDAARRSRFDVNTAAPERHIGTITYIFIPQ